MQNKYEDTWLLGDLEQVCIDTSRYFNFKKLIFFVNLTSRALMHWVNPTYHYCLSECLQPTPSSMSAGNCNFHIPQCLGDNTHHCHHLSSTPLWRVGCFNNLPTFLHIFLCSGVPGARECAVPGAQGIGCHWMSCAFLTFCSVFLLLLFYFKLSSKSFFFDQGCGGGYIV